MIDSEPDLYACLAREGPDFPTIIGTPETDWLEFKTDLGNLAHLSAKLELAKDVAQLANHNGGVLVVGVRTDRQPMTAADVAVEIRSLANAQVNFDQLRQIIGAHVYPSIKRLSLKVWSAGNERSLVSITVPNQEDWERPFLVTAGVSDDGLIRTNMIGLYVRDGAGGASMSAEYIHELLRTGMQIRKAGIPADPASLVQLSALASGRTTGHAWIESDKLDDILASDLADSELHEDTYLYVQAWRPPGFELQDLHARGTGGLRPVFEDPPQLRPNGFNIDFGGEVRVTSGGGLQRIRPSIGAVSLTRTGILTVVVGSYYLGWAMEKHRFKNSINPLALEELVSEACRLAFTVATRDARTRRTSFRAGLRGLSPERLWYLVEDLPSIARFWNDPHPPGGDAAAVEVAEIESDEPESAAFRLLSSIYAQFGLSPDEILHSKAQQGVIDFTALSSGKPMMPQ